jgi:DNA-binding NarL/FixJ family response regulator
VLIVDDHAGFRAAARAFLEDGGFEVVGEAADGRSAIDAVRRLRPEILLLDVKLPDVDGFAVAAELADGAPQIVFTSSRGITAYRRRLATNPAWSFVGKSDLTVESLAAALA